MVILDWTTPLRTKLGEIALYNVQAWDRKYLKNEEDNLARERIDRTSRERSDRVGGGGGGVGVGGGLALLPR